MRIDGWSWLKLTTSVPIHSTHLHGNFARSNKLPICPRGWLNWKHSLESAKARTSDGIGGGGGGDCWFTASNVTSWTRCLHTCVRTRVCVCVCLKEVGRKEGREGGRGLEGRVYQFEVEKGLRLSAVLGGAGGDEEVERGRNVHFTSRCFEERQRRHLMAPRIVSFCPLSNFTFVNYFLSASVLDALSAGENTRY